VGDEIEAKFIGIVARIARWVVDSGQAMSWLEAEEYQQSDLPAEPLRSVIC
jgi:hypothetical protein